MFRAAAATNANIVPTLADSPKREPQRSSSRSPLTASIFGGDNSTPKVKREPADLLAADLVHASTRPNFPPGFSTNHVPVCPPDPFTSASAATAADAPSGVSSTQPPCDIAKPVSSVHAESPADTPSGISSTQIPSGFSQAFPSCTADSVAGVPANFCRPPHTSMQHAQALPTATADESRIVPVGFGETRVVIRRDPPADLTPGPTADNHAIAVAKYAAHHSREFSEVTFQEVEQTTEGWLHWCFLGVDVSAHSAIHERLRRAWAERKEMQSLFNDLPDIAKREFRQVFICMWIVVAHISLLYL